RQRAALARALSLETGILLMDEPFGALDEQTRMILGEDLSVLLSRTEKTIVFVTHSLGEAVFLADRVAVFSARPGHIKEIIRVDEPHPRNPNFVTTEKFGRLRNQLYELLHEEIRKAVEQSAVAGAPGKPSGADRLRRRSGRALVSRHGLLGYQPPAVAQPGQCLGAVARRAGVRRIPAGPRGDAGRGRGGVCHLLHLRSGPWLPLQPLA